MEAIGERVHQEAADELACCEPHDLELVAVMIPVIFPAEADVIVAQLVQAAVGDRDAVRVAGEVGEDLGGVGKRPLGVDHPFAAAERDEIRPQGGPRLEVLQLAEEPQPTGAVQCFQALEEQAAEQP
jgi:hypothetical protein